MKWKGCEGCQAWEQQLYALAQLLCTYMKVNAQHNSMRAQPLDSGYDSGSECLTSKRTIGCIACTAIAPITQITDEPIEAKTPKKQIEISILCFIFRFESFKNIYLSIVRLKAKPRIWMECDFWSPIHCLMNQKKSIALRIKFYYSII